MSSKVSYFPAKEAPSRSSAVPEERTAKRSTPSPAAASNIWADISPKCSSAAGVTTKPGGTGNLAEARRARLAAFAPSSEVRRFVASAKVTTGGVGTPLASSVFTVSSSSLGRLERKSSSARVVISLPASTCGGRSPKLRKRAGIASSRGLLRSRSTSRGTANARSPSALNTPLATPLWPSDWNVWMTRIGSSRRRWTSARSRSCISVPVASFLHGAVDAHPAQRAHHVRGVADQEQARLVPALEAAYLD